MSRVLDLQMPFGYWLIDFPSADAAGHYTETDLGRALTTGFKFV